MLPVLIAVAIQKTRSQIWRVREILRWMVSLLQNLQRLGTLSQLTIGGHEITMQLDTGAAVSFIPKPTYKTHFTEFPLTETKPLKSYLDD